MDLMDLFLRFQSHQSQSPSGTLLPPTIQKPYSLNNTGANWHPSAQTSCLSPADIMNKSKEGYKCCTSYKVNDDQSQISEESIDNEKDEMPSQMVDEQVINLQMVEDSDKNWEEKQQIEILE